MDNPKEEVINSQFQMCLDSLKECSPGTIEFDYFWKCIVAYAEYYDAKKYYKGFKSNGQTD